MKSVAIALVKVFAVSVFLSFTMLCSGQELKTVKECQAYREAWLTSAENDTRDLPAKELLHRADQMMTCAKVINAEPFKTGMTHDEALNAAILATGYATLALSYYQEAFNRAAWFIDNKGLTREFVAADANGEIKKRKLEEKR